MDNKPLMRGQWLDSLNWHALGTMEDVQEVFERVHQLQAAQIIKKIRLGTYYMDSLATA